MSDFRKIAAGPLMSSTTGDVWNKLATGTTDLYSCWVRCSSAEGFIAFHYNLISADWAGTIRVQASNDPGNANLDAVNVQLSDSTTGVAVSAGTSASGFLHVSKNKANFFRLMLDIDSGSGANYITATVHQ